ncbi:MAG: GerAB/ArcD/ProY family transporter [Clostridia bacterium]|nr:GerAB/ArcD/ProY family transporter [Clostridia bacterium]
MLQRKEMTTLLINVISTKMLLTFPKIMIIDSGNSAWIQAIYNTAIAFLIFWVTMFFYRGNKNIITLAENFGGKTLKIIVGVVVFSVLMINCASIIRLFPETVKIVLLQDFKVEFIIAAFLVAIGIGAYMGIEAIGKINNMFIPIAGMVFLTFLLLLIPYYRFENILPIFGEGYKAIFVKGFNTISLFSDLLLLNILLPHCENLYEARKSGQKAIFISGVIAVLILLSYCLIYPYPASKDFMIPVYQLSRIIHLSSFFSRFEAMFQFIWSILMLLYSAIYIYTMCYILQTTLSLKHYKPLVFPVVVLIGIIGMIPGSVIDLVKSEKLENIIVYPAAFILPFLFGLVSRKYYGEKRKE